VGDGGRGDERWMHAVLPRVAWCTAAHVHGGQIQPYMASASRFSTYAGWQLYVHTHTFVQLRYSGVHAANLQVPSDVLAQAGGELLGTLALRQVGAADG
jgi:hypothetical protein